MPQGESLRPMRAASANLRMRYLYPQCKNDSKITNDLTEYGKMHAGNNKKTQEKEGMDKSMQCCYKSKKTEMAVGRTCSKKNRPSLDQGDTRLDPK
ncbi:UNVERIFIED_CONTAM: hypothetical protein FKN15_055930 [Acipenser sinensis]